MTLLHVWLLNDRAGFRFHVSLSLQNIFSVSRFPFTNVLIHLRPLYSLVRSTNTCGKCTVRYAIVTLCAPPPRSSQSKERDSSKHQNDTARTVLKELKKGVLWEDRRVPISVLGGV